MFIGNRHICSVRLYFVRFPSAQIILPGQLEILANITEIHMNIDEDLRITSSNCMRVAAQTCPV